MKGLSIEVKVEGLERLKQAVDSARVALKEVDEAAVNLSFTIGNADLKTVSTERS